MFDSPSASVNVEAGSTTWGYELGCGCVQILDRTGIGSVTFWRTIEHCQRHPRVPPDRKGSQ